MPIDQSADIGTIHWKRGRIHQFRVETGPGNLILICIEYCPTFAPKIATKFSAYEEYLASFLHREWFKTIPEKNEGVVGADPNGVAQIGCGGRTQLAMVDAGFIKD